jgi:hypothetical protein
MLIRPLQSDDEARACAAMMATSDPWLTLGRDFDGALAFLTDGMKEIHVAVDGDAVLGVMVINMRGPFIYERLGYEVVGTLRDYIRRGYDEILMRKSLGPMTEFVRT